MGLTKHLTPAQRHEIIGAKKNRVPLTQIASNMNLKKSTVQYTWRMRNRRPDQHDMPHGRPRKTTIREDNELYQRLRENPWLTLRETIDVSALKRTQLKLRMHDFKADFRKHRAPYRPYLSATNR